MKGNAQTILSYAASATELLEALSDQLVTAAPTGQPFDFPKCLSNAGLLMETLVAFYEDERRAAYFPQAADAEILAHLSQLVRELQTFKQQATPPQALAAVTQADALYAAALRLGVISFGLSANDLKELATDLRAKRKAAERLLLGVEERRDKLLNEAAEVTPALTGKLAAETSQLRTDLAAAVEECAKQRAEISSRLEELDQLQENLTAKHAQIDEAVATARSATEAAKGSAAEADEEAASAKLDATHTREARAKAKEEMEAILAFYADIEKHQAAMRETQKEANARLNGLTSKYEQLQADFEERTSQVISTNESLQAEIRGHLERSVGASLFSAFDVRRRNLGWGKWTWALGLLASVAAGALLSAWLAESVKGASVEPAFFVKLSAVIPVTFAIFFAARQYSRERRTEEEYAFKSTISVSLEPYRELLNRMRGEGQEQSAAFVEKLLAEVFDNPVKRVYADDGGREAGGDEALPQLADLKKFIALAKGVDPDAVKKLMELAKSAGISLKVAG